MRIFIIGLAWKLLIADEVAPIADIVFDNAARPRMIEAWLGVYTYAMQIYFDFGGYSAMAVGLGVMMGFTLPRNFRVPYAALSMTGFWRCWHMSLSAWLRDYLYIPLGGSRGSALRTYANLWAVFLLCGLWHGASWTFVIWGAHHGLFLAIERAGLGRILARLPSRMAHLYTIIVTFSGWIWFRSAGVYAAVRMFGGVLGLNGLGDIPIQLHILLSPLCIFTLLVAGILSIWRWPPVKWSLFIGNRPGVLAVGDTILISVLLLLCMIAAGAKSYSPFLYYRFEVPMLVPWRRFQGIAVVAILILVMIGGCLPDPFVTQTSPSQARPAKKGMIAEIVRLFDSSKSDFDHNMNYAASAPLLRSLIKYELGASSSPQVYIGQNHHLFYSGVRRGPVGRRRLQAT